MLKEYILENWALLLISVAFVILLKTTVFMERKAIRRMLILIASVFLLSVAVFVEFYLGDRGIMPEFRTVLTAVRYSATPFIMAMILFTLIQKSRWFVFIPAAVFSIINIVSIFTGIVFSIDGESTLKRGPLGYLPYIAVGLYSIFLVYALFKHSNRQLSEIIPIVFLSLAFISGLILPFILGKDYSKIFCTTIMVALFVYYVFSILQLTSKDALTGLLNRQAYYAAVSESAKNITGMISIDMNGLKTINDNGGHNAGDEALKTLAQCFLNALQEKHTAYRVGGDEFVIVCRRSSEDEIVHLIGQIRDNLSKTAYSCSIGYSCTSDGAKTVDEMLKESDQMMYADKSSHYMSLNSDCK